MIYICTFPLLNVRQGGFESLSPAVIQVRIFKVTLDSIQ